MKNIKSVAICAAAGYVLSLVSGFFSKSSFGRIFLIALIFGIIFGVLAFGISFVFEKFLSVESVASENTEGSGSAGFVPSSEKRNLGQNVDIIIQDEPLEPSSNPNRYDVGENHQMLNESDYNSSGDAAKETKETIVPKDEFVPIRNLETVSNFSSNESETPKEAETRREAIVQQQKEKGTELDVLPDMSDFKIKSDSEGSEDDTVIISDSDEAQFVHSSTNYKSSDVGSGEIKDASLMAKAISSILSEET